MALIALGATLVVVALFTESLPPNSVKGILLALVGTYLLQMTSACTRAANAKPLFIARLGQASAFSGFVLFTLLLWTESESVFLWKVMASLVFFASSAAHTSWLLVKGLPLPFKFVRIVSLVSGWFVSLTMLISIWFPKLLPDSGTLFLSAFIVAIASSLVLKIIARLHLNAGDDDR